MAFTWTKDLETGNIQIDNEHKELISAINKLLDACANGQGKTELENTVNFLNRYTKMHFAHEQKLQEDSKYPNYVQHCKYHAEFIRTIDDITMRLKRDGATIALIGEINLQLGKWFINHIKTEDVKVAKHLLTNAK